MFKNKTTTGSGTAKKSTFFSVSISLKTHIYCNTYVRIIIPTYTYVFPHGRLDGITGKTKGHNLRNNITFSHCAFLIPIPARVVRYLHADGTQNTTF